MSWFNKKDKKELKSSSDLHGLPPLPDDFGERFPDSMSKANLPQLPNFPQSQLSEKISNEAVKQIIKEDLPKFNPQLASKHMVQEIEDDLPEIPDVNNMPLIKPTTREIKSFVKVEPVYVRIDKYQESLINFQEVKRKLLEIENLLKDVKDIKAREDSELDAWEQEIQKAKDKLALIDSTLFQKLE